MQNNTKIEAPSKEIFYKIMLVRLESILSSEKDNLANISNSAAHLFNNLEDVNWSGFYFMKDGELVLGPFCGKPACTRIKIGNGVCGTTAQNGTSTVVEDVHKFPGHIACDSASNSEIVVPIKKDGKVIGVLDIDSPKTNTFDETDRVYLEKYVDKMNQYIKWDEFIKL